MKRFARLFLSLLGCILTLTAYGATIAANAPLPAPAEATGHDLVIEKAVVENPIYKLGTAVSVKVTIRNVGEVQAQNPMVKYTINGGEINRKLNSVKLNTGDTFTVSVSVSTKELTEEGIAVIDLEAAWRDGTADDTPDDNKAQVKVYLTNSEPNHRMVCEEGTGVWCGWCVKGIVGLRKMVEKYGERFIPIAVHTGEDPMKNDVYAYFITDVMRIVEYPSCWVNREPGGHNPNFKYIEPYMTAMPKYSVFDVDVTADVTEEVFDMTARVTPLLDSKDGYHIVFAITEDGIPGVQQNFYYDGNSGEMDGFENLPLYVNLDFEYVARGMWPGPTDRDISAFKLPTTMEAGKTYELNYRLDTSEVQHRDLSRCSVIAMLVSNVTGCVINANKYDPEKAAGVHSVLAPRPTTTATYNLSGQRVGRQSSATQHGITIHDGKKVVR